MTATGQITAAGGTPPRPALLAHRAVAEWVGLSQRTLRRMVAAGTFPAPVAIPGLRGGRFRGESVGDWLESYAL